MLLLLLALLIDYGLLLREELRWLDDPERVQCNANSQS